MKNKYIMWEKYKDPWSVPQEEDNWDSIGYNTSHGISTKEDNGPALLTPMGPMPFNKINCPSNTFNFWMGHANFRISDKIASLIEDTNGVESLDILTPHRMRISVGQCFKPSEVTYKIAEIVTEYFNAKT